MPPAAGANVNVPLPPVVATVTELGPENPLLAVVLTLSVALELPEFVKLTVCVDEPGNVVSANVTMPEPVRARMAPREVSESATLCALSPGMSVLTLIVPP